MNGFLIIITLPVIPSTVADNLLFCSFLLQRLCLFVGFYGSGNAGDFIVERCAFRDNVCQHSSWNNTDGYFTSQQFGTCVSLEAQGTTTLVRDCSFVGNVVTNFDGCGASCIVSRSNASKAVAVNCTFEANVAIARENLDRKGTWRSVGNAGTINYFSIPQALPFEQSTVESGTEMAQKWQWQWHFYLLYYLPWGIMFGSLLGI